MFFKIAMTITRTVVLITIYLLLVWFVDGKETAIDHFLSLLVILSLFAAILAGVGIIWLYWFIWAGT